MTIDSAIIWRALILRLSVHGFAKLVDCSIEFWKCSPEKIENMTTYHALFSL